MSRALCQKYEAEGAAAKLLGTLYSTAVYTIGHGKVIKVLNPYRLKFIQPCFEGILPLPPLCSLTLFRISILESSHVHSPDFLVFDRTILLTSLEMLNNKKAATIDRCRSAGMNQYLSKEQGVSRQPLSLCETLAQQSV